MCSSDLLMPLTVAGTSAGPALRAVLVYLVIYAATNLGAFAVIIAVSRKTRSGEISSFGGLFSYAPGLTVMMTLFLASLAGKPIILPDDEIFRTVERFKGYGAGKRVASKRPGKR